MAYLNVSENGDGTISITDGGKDEMRGYPSAKFIANAINDYTSRTAVSSNSGESGLVEYAAALGLNQELTVSALIAAHRDLVQTVKELREERDAHWKKAMNEAKDTYEKYQADYISIEKLRAMTLAEIAEYL